MKTRYELLLRVFSSYVEEDGFAHFTYTNLYCVGKNDTIKRYMAEMKEIGVIEDFTVNGYATRIKINKQLDCPDFLCNSIYDILTKDYLLEQWKTYKELGKIVNINPSPEGKLNALSTSSEEIVKNAKIIKNHIHSTEGVLTKTENGYKITAKPKSHMCIYCGETDPTKFGSSKTICKECDAKHQRDAVPQKEKLFKRSAKRARRVDLAYNLDEEYIEELFKCQNNKCYYSGIEFGDNFSNKITYPTIDRIDSSKGYEKGNVCLCTFVVNQMKNNLTTDQFKDIVTKIYNNIDNF